MVVVPMNTVISMCILYSMVSIFFTKIFSLAL